MGGVTDATPSGHFLNCPNNTLQPDILAHHRNKRMIRGRLFGKHPIFQMVRMMIDGIIGVLRTGVQSGMLATNLLSMKTRRFLHLHSILRGVHPKELLKDCVRSIQSYHSNVSMMNQEWNQQGITRTVCKVSTWGCMRNPIPL